ncbi:MAG: type II toxin-antitoxin system mRNA interferase toxin, RelE/StbE family [bacterium]|nr:type II toxin-antitoxin system mRNA interferase toxin, RelE/StbE family [bacterium]
MIYTVVVTRTGADTLKQKTEKRILRLLDEKIRGLAHVPEQQGEPLRDEFEGYRALHVIGNRYRIIYRVERDIVSVFVVGAGIRKAEDKQDVYAVMRRYVRLGLIEVPEAAPKPQKKTRK